MKVCDRDTVERYFEEYARGFWTIFGGIVQRQSKDFGLPSFGAGLREFGNKLETTKSLWWQWW